MPFGDFINNIPPAGFLLIHMVLFLAGAYFAWRSFQAGERLIAYGFVLFALGEIMYLTYHLNWTVILFAHTIAEVLILLAFTLIFIGVSRTWPARTSET